MNTNRHSRFDAPEFPGYANVRDGDGEAVPLDDNPVAADLNRRKFLALSAALGATVVGCRRPDLQILPYSAIPDEQLGHLASGRPTFYATCLPRAGGALPVLVESHDGRPTKVEGNPRHPASGGSTDIYAQASVLDLYSPDRVMSDKYPGVMEKGSPRRWEDFDRVARTLADKLTKNQGEGFFVLADQAPSPSLRRIREHIKDTFPKASWHTYEPIDTSEALKGAEIAFGQKLAAKYNFAQIDRILALDSDFLGCDPDAVEYNRAFATRRHGEKMNRLYAVESTYTVTGTMADHRLRLAASQIGGLLVAVVREMAALGVKPLQAITLPATSTILDAKWVKAVARDLATSPQKAAVIVGPRQPAWVHALAHAVNTAMVAHIGNRDLLIEPKGNEARACVEFRAPSPEATEKGIGELVAAMRGGKVQTLVILGGNPVLNAPADLGFRAELQKVSTKIRLGLFHDQTSEACDWHLPLSHPLESWGDSETTDGTLCCVQPLIAPLNGNKTPGADTEAPPRGGRTALEVFAILTQYPSPADNKAVGTFAAAQKAAYGTVRKVFSERSGIAMTDKTFDTEFNKYKQLGFLPAEKDKGIRGRKNVEIKPAEVTKALAAYKPVATPSADALEVTFHPDGTLFDGRFSMNPWLQELPDPITKLVWDNAAVISPKTADEFKLKHGDVVQLALGADTLDIPVYVLPGQADYSVALAYGQCGEMRVDRVPDGGGTNVFPLRKSTALHTTTGATLKKTGRTYDLVMTQEHGVIPEGRDIIRDVDSAKYAELVKNGHGHSHSHEEAGGEHPKPKIGVTPDGHVTEADQKKGFQGGYGNPQQPPAPATEKQERFSLDLARPELLDSQFQWAMTIDLSTCTGCTACLIACQTENNIPVVGKQEVKRNRELHWIRIDRYFSSDGKTADAEPRIVNQPVACVQCEAAPCEQVCPVNAAVHSPEGLNLQVYNRCIGTRYCANACPYKVRRFNWFDFNKRGLDELRTPTPYARGGSSFTENLLPETLKMQKNPDVTVRMRGVMEKCTYCVQRIERGKYGAKIAAAEVANGRRTIETDAAFKPEGDAPPTAYKKPKNPKAAGYDLDAKGRVIVPDGLIVTACQAACPAQAITFGNVLDPNSAVAKAKRRAGEYLLLGELNTKPRTSFLPRVRNPNPELA